MYACVYAVKKHTLISRTVPCCAASTVFFEPLEHCLTMDQQNLPGAQDRGAAVGAGRGGAPGRTAPRRTWGSARRRARRQRAAAGLAGGRGDHSADQHALAPQGLCKPGDRCDAWEDGKHPRGAAGPAADREALRAHQRAISRG